MTLSRVLSSVCRSLLLAALFSVGPSFAADDTLLIKQKGAYLGAVTIYVRSDAFRLEQGSTVRVARAPNWDVIWFNPSKQNYYKVPYEKALKNVRTFEPSEMASGLGNEPWHRAGTSKIAGLTCFEWINPGAQGKDLAQKASDLHCYVLGEPKLGRKGVEFISMLLGLPYLEGLPLRYSLVGKESILLPMRMRAAGQNEPRKRHNVLDTIEAKWTSVPASVFDVPKGFKRTDKFGSVYLNSVPMKDNVILQDLLKNPEALFNSQ